MYAGGIPTLCLHRSHVMHMHGIARHVVHWLMHIVAIHAAVSVHLPIERIGILALESASWNERLLDVDLIKCQIPRLLQPSPLLLVKYRSQ